MKHPARLGCAALVGAAIAFPAGLTIGSRNPAAQQAAEKGKAAPTGRATVRNFYTPNFRTDPYVLDQQRQVADALELSCREFGERCREAAEARRRIEELQ